MATLSVNVQDLATRVATEIKSVRTLLNGNQSDLSALTTTAKANLVVAINELKAAIDAGGSGDAVIDDGTISTETVWSSSKTNEAIDAAIDALVNGAGSALDTLKELADALGNDPNFATTIATALGNRVRVDAAQSFTAPQQAQGRSNIGAASAADVGDTDADFVAIFEAGLA